jgi:hypothetical protein
MFHTLSELQEKEKNKGKPIQKKSISTMSKEKSPEDNYYGKGNKAYDHYNKKPTESLNVKFEKTKNKITLIAFQNGFILNNGPFRDRAIKENDEFMKEVEKGNIPHELIEKGIDDLGILLINRKNEIYHQPSLTPITQITQITQINPINPITINPNPNLYVNNATNGLNNLDNIFNTYTYNYGNNYPYQYNSNTYSTYNTFGNDQYNNLLYDQIFNQPQTQPQIQPQNLYNQNNNNLFSNNNQYQYENQYYDPLIENIQNYTSFGIPKSRDRAYSHNITNTPMDNRNTRKEIFVPYTEKRDYNRRNKYTSSVPKKPVQSKFETFHNFKRMELIKEEEKKKEKQKKKIKEKSEEKKDEKKENEDKKFIAFGGMGQAIGNINTEGLNVQADLKNSVDIFKPICPINIRLFNGEIAKGEFNYSQTLRDIYFYVRKISGSNNFTLLDGFPPVPLRDYDKTIGQLNLENTTLTQRINS